MKGKGEGRRSRTQHNKGAKRTMQVEWEFGGGDGGGQMIFKEKRVELDGTEYWGTEACLEGTRTARGLHCLAGSEELKSAKPKKEKIHKTTKTPLCILSIAYL